MVRTIFIPLTKQMSHAEVFYMRANGDRLADFQNRLVDTREEQEATLDAALDKGYTVISADVVADAQGAFIAVMVYKPGNSE